MKNTSGERQKNNQMFSLTLFLLTESELTMYLLNIIRSYLLCRKVPRRGTFSGGHTNTVEMLELSE